MFVDEAGEDLKLAPGMTSAQEAYVRNAFAQVYANPSTAGAISNLESSGVTIYVRENDLGADQNLTGLTQGDVSQGVLVITVDQAAQQQNEQAGGDSSAENLADELKHADNALQQGDAYNPNEHASIDEFKEDVGANSPTEETKKDADKVLDKNPHDPENK